MCRDSRMWWPELGVILFWPQFYGTSLLFVFKNTNAVFFGQWAAAGTGVKLVKNIFTKVLQMGWRRQHPRVWLSDSQTAIREYVWLFLYSTVHKKGKEVQMGSVFQALPLWEYGDFEEQKGLLQGPSLRLPACLESKTAELDSIVLALSGFPHQGECSCRPARVSRSWRKNKSPPKEAQQLKTGWSGRIITTHT